MMKGDLVFVHWFEIDWQGRKLPSSTLRPGIVVDVRPDHLGGTGMVTWRSRDSGTAGSEIVSSPRRAEILVQLTDTEGISWFDEANVFSATEPEPRA